MHEVDCWSVALDAPSHRLESAARLLSADERAAADRFRFVRDRTRYVASHVALRTILSRYLGDAPEDILFTRSSTGKPEIVRPAAPLFFNLSHSSELAVIAVCSTAQVGVDVEITRDVPDFMDLARDHFSRVEVAGIENLPVARRSRGFLVTWVRKEAFVKGTGAGLAVPLSEFATGAPDRPPCLTDANGCVMTNWTLRDLQFAGGVGALAVRALGGEVRVRQH